MPGKSAGQMILKPCGSYLGVDIYFMNPFYTVFLGTLPFRSPNLHEVTAYIDTWDRLKLN